MRKAILLTLILLLGNYVCALEIKNEMPKQVPPLSIHDILPIKEYKFLKLLIYPLISEEGLVFSGFKIVIKINDYPKFDEDQK